jgi:DNA replication protein DnaC
MDLRAAMGDWRRQVNGRELTPAGAAPWPAIDAEHHRRRLAVQAANRNRAYTRTLPSRYANAAYSMLRPQQDPQGKVSRWLRSKLRTLVLAGPPRTGKTTAAYAIANDAHRQGLWVVARPAIELSAALKPDGEPLAYEYATTCDLLILDDLGRDRATEWWLEQLHGIADARCADHRRLIVTSNCADLDELAARYGDPLVERLLDGGGLLVLDGPAIRQVTTEW